MHVHYHWWIKYFQKSPIARVYSLCTNISSYMVLYFYTQYRRMSLQTCYMCLVVVQFRNPYQNYYPYTHVSNSITDDQLDGTCTLATQPFVDIFISFHSRLSHQGPAKEARPIKAGSHYLHYHLNNLNTEKNPSPAVT